MWIFFMIGGYRVPINIFENKKHEKSMVTDYIKIDCFAWKDIIAKGKSRVLG